MRRKVVLHGHADAGRAEKRLVKPVSIERMKKAITQLAPAAAGCARNCDLWDTHAKAAPVTRAPNDRALAFAQRNN